MRPARFLSFGAAATLAVLGIAAPGQAEPPKHTGPANAVLELFTSQGCSSCPPADKLLAGYGKKPGVIALSYSVDYWNYLGWHDTLSSPENSKRQREYARVRGDGKVYTPQIVVDGVDHVNGSNEAAIEMALRNTGERLAQVKVPVSMHADGDTLVIDIGATSEGSDKREATVWLAIAKHEETVSITRGENRGKELSYFHPVRELTPIGMWKGEAMSLKLPLKDLKTMGGDCLVALLQMENAGPILGVAQYERM
ncbi:MAG: DUF1223 domain-containing protein [Methyloceanibacter sp.]